MLTRSKHTTNTNIAAAEQHATCVCVCVLVRTDSADSHSFPENSSPKLGSIRQPPDPAHFKIHFGASPPPPRPHHSTSHTQSRRLARALSSVLILNSLHCALAATLRHSVLQPRGALHLSRTWLARLLYRRKSLVACVASLPFFKSSGDSANQLLGRSTCPAPSRK